jgi:hypothetical protein
MRMISSAVTVVCCISSQHPCPDLATGGQKARTPEEASKFQDDLTIFGKHEGWKDVFRVATPVAVQPYVATLATLLEHF